MQLKSKTYEFNNKEFVQKLGLKGHLIYLRLIGDQIQVEVANEEPKDDLKGAMAYLDKIGEEIKNV
jgi:hypothetical protein